MAKTHWTSSFECRDHRGQLEKPIFLGASCKGPNQTGKYKLGVKEAVDCKTCIRMRDRLMKKQVMARP